MTIYADPSFLVSWLYAADLNHSKAAHWFATHQADDWLVSPWSEFETINTLRSLCLRTPGPAPELVERLRRYFKHLFRQGSLVREATDWIEALKDANQISAALAALMPARAADTLHVAILEQLNPDIFVTCDEAQSRLVARRGFNVVWVH